MATFKRCLSAFLAIAMVFGMLSGMGNVFAPEASAASALGSPTIKTYAELCSSYDHFVYFGTEVREIEVDDAGNVIADNGPTDGKVPAGQWLEYRAHIKSDMWVSTIVTGIQFDKRFFDAHATAKPVASESYDVGAVGTMNDEHPMTSERGISVKYTVKPAASQNQFSGGYTKLDAATYANLDDAWQTTAYDVNVSTLASDISTDTWLYKFYAKVLDEPTVTEAKSYTEPSTWKISPNASGTQGTPQVNSNLATGALLSELADAPARSTCKNMNLTTTNGVGARFGVVTVLLDDACVNFEIEVPEEPAAPVEGQSVIKSYADLCEDYDHFVYFGTEVYEIEVDGAGNVVANNGITDHYVQPGQWLMYEAHIKSDMWVSTIVTGIQFDKRFFDAHATAKPVVSTSYDVGAVGTMNDEHPMTSERGISVKYTVKPATSQNQFTGGYTKLDESVYVNLDDAWQTTAYDVNVSTVASDISTDTWLYKFYARVLENPTISEGKSYSEPSTWKISPNAAGTQGTPQVNSNLATGALLSELADAPARSTCKNMNLTTTNGVGARFGVVTVLLDDACHVFKLGNPPAAGSNNTATFVVDGVEVDSAEYAAGAEIAVPADPSKDGYKFMGWAVDGAIVNEFVMGDADVTFEAVFAKLYKATFVVDGVVVSEETYVKGEAIVAPADPTKTGATFAGWSPAVGTMGEADVTFTAQWTTKTYTVEYFKETTDTVAYATLTAAYNGAYNLPAPPNKTGYTFVKWVDAAGNDMPALHTADANAKFYAVWEKATFNAIFDANGGSFAAGTTVTVPTAFGDAIVAPAEEPTRVGYAFGGWEGYTAGTTMGAADVTFKAIWNANQIGVHFMDGETELQVVVGDYGSKVYQIPNPSKTGYTFKGWAYADGTTVTWPVTLGVDDVVVYAIWEGNDITINFYGETESDWLAYTTLKAGAELVVPADAAAPTKKGYTFVGYFDAEGNAMPATVPAQDTNYFARFEAVTYTATFVDGDAVVGTYEGIYNSTIVLPAEPTKEGYTFAGWEGYTAGMKMPAADKTFTAKWTVNTYVVTYYVDGAVVNTVELAYGAAIPEYTYVPADAGVNFAGWTTVIPATMPAANLDVYGTTGKNTYNVTFTVNGEVYAVVPFEYGAAVVAPDYEVAEGYTFGGWDVPATMPAENITVDAALTANTYVAKFWLDEAMTKLYTEVPTVYGEAIDVPVDPQVDGKAFLEWDPMPDLMAAGDMNFIAVFEDIEYVVAFYNEDGSEIDGASWIAFWGDEIAADDAPAMSKEGYDFAGWYYEDGTKATFPVVVNGDVELTAKFTVQGYKVIYYVDGVEYDYDAYAFGDAIALRADLVKEGYTFSGWDVELPATMPANDIIVNGTFTVNYYDAIFVAENGWTETVSTAYGTVPAAPAAPEKAGYAFVGWEPALAPMGINGATYTAKYSAGDSTYKVITKVMGTDGEYVVTEETLTAATDTVITHTPAIETGFALNADSVLSGTVAADNSLVLTVVIDRIAYNFTVVADGETTTTAYLYGAAVAAPATPVKEGYTFTGWDNAVPATMPANDVTLTAKFVINQYTITFDTVGGTPIAAIKADFGTAVVAPAAPTKVGYTFAGWDVEVPATIPAEDITITAQWTINQYTITFVDTGDVAYEAITADYNTAIADVADPVKTGYTFTGWDVAIPANMPAEDMTITATWKINQYAATFVVDGVETVVMTDYNAVPVFADPAKMGHSFAGWEPALAPMGVDGATYTAKWTALAYDAIFDANDGAWADGSTQKVVADVVFGTAIEAPAEDPTREGYIFAGWAPVVGNMDVEGKTFLAQWTQDLAYCRIQSVDRITEGVFEEQRAVYKIKVLGSPVKVQLIHNIENGTSWTYDRGTGAAEDYVAGDLTTSGLVGVQAYNAANEAVAFGSADTAYEVWTIVTILTEGDYKVRAKLDYTSSSWEDKAFAYDYTMKFDEKTIDEAATLLDVNLSDNVVKRGEYLTVSFVAAPEVDRIRIAMDNGDGTSTIMSYSKTATAVQSIEQNADGNNVWTLKIRFTYSGNEDSQDQNWVVWFRVAGNAAWIKSDKAFDVKVTKYAPVEETVPGYAAYSLISIDAPAEGVKNKLTTLVIKTTSDITRVRLNNQAGKTATFLATSTNATAVDNGDGTTTWTISYRFTAAGEQTWAVQVRGNTWSTIDADSLFTINVA